MPQLTENFFRQDPGESLADVPRYNDGPRRLRFTHIIHPYTGRNSEHNRAVQEITFETMRTATRGAAQTVSVRCVCVTFPHEVDLIPNDFIKAAPLERTVLDVGEFENPRTLPLLFDVLDNGIAVPEEPLELPDCEDFVILTNSDIHLQPHFYLAVAEFIRSGYDFININRRTIPQYAPLLAELPLMYGELGLDHPGIDCLVFPRGQYTSFIKNRACVGVLYVMRALVFNSVSLARRYLVLTAAHLTFHLGDDRAWKGSDFADYSKFNLEEGAQVAGVIARDKLAAQKLLSYLKATQAQPAFVRAAETGAGIVRPPAPLRRRVFERPRIIARRVARRLRNLL